MAYRDDDAALRERHDLLSRIRIATPCDAEWEWMIGDDRVRHCSLCDRSVYDLSKMTSAEAVALMEASGERLPCVRLHRRRDGTVITSDCERGRARRRKRGLVVLATAAACTLAATLTSAHHDPPRPSTHRASARLTIAGEMGRLQSAPPATRREPPDEAERYFHPSPRPDPAALGGLGVITLHPIDEEP